MGVKRSILAGILGKLAVVGGGTVFLQQTFSGTPGTALTALTPTVGGTWTAQTGFAPASPDAIDSAGTALYSPTTSGCYQNSASPGSADYYVEAVLVMRSAGGDIGVIARADPAANTFYFVRFGGSSWALFRCVNGASAQLGTAQTDSWTTGNRTVRLTVSGTTISFSIDGATLVTVTDSGIAAAGHAGIRLVYQSGSGGAIHMASVVAATLS